MQKYKGKALDLAHMMAAPITALVEADAIGIHTFYQFLEKVAFEPSSKQQSAGANNNNLGKLRYVYFTYDRVEKGKRIPTQIKVPLLSLLPLPAMEVDNARLSFYANIVDSIQEPPSLTGLKAMPVSATVQRPQRLLATFAPAEGHGATAIKVDIDLQSSDMPAGLASLLNIMSNAITSNQETLSVSPPNCEISYDEAKNKATITVVSTDEQDLPVNDDITFTFENPNPQGKIRGKNLSLTVVEGTKVRDVPKGTIVVIPTAGKARIAVSLMGQPPERFETAEACYFKVSQGNEPYMKTGGVAIKILPGAS